MTGEREEGSAQSQPSGRPSADAEVTAGRNAEPSAAREPRAVWLTEPAERSWVDPATGYQCLARRGPAGAWCGYVRVPDDHPAHGAGYYVYSVDFDELVAGKWPPERVALQARINDIRVHGGLTFAGDGRPTAAGEAEGWWLGFDCAHAGDYSPDTDRLDHPSLGLGRPTGWGGVIEYRDLAYVEAQCTSLAAQIAALAKATSTPA